MILINAAKRHYKDFKVANSFVEARKTKRAYHSSDQSDLDIKTSINKIGEIINLSQELNTYIWDTLNHGGELKDIMPLYYKVCQLNIMSNIEISFNSLGVEMRKNKYIELLKNHKAISATA